MIALLRWCRGGSAAKSRQVSESRGAVGKTPRRVNHCARGGTRRVDAGHTERSCPNVGYGFAVRGAPIRRTRITANIDLSMAPPEISG